MKELIEHIDRDEFDESEYVDYDLKADILHHENNDGDGNRHAIVAGEDVFIIE